MYIINIKVYLLLLSKHIIIQLFFYNNFNITPSKRVFGDPTHIASTLVVIWAWALGEGGNQGSPLLMTGTGNCKDNLKMV